MMPNARESEGMDDQNEVKSARECLMIGLRLEAIPTCGSGG
jgi:hypothetical protein